MKDCSALSQSYVEIAIEFGVKAKPTDEDVDLEYRLSQYT